MVVFGLSSSFILPTLHVPTSLEVIRCQQQLEAALKILEVQYDAMEGTKADVCDLKGGKLSATAAAPFPALSRGCLQLLILKKVRIQPFNRVYMQSTKHDPNHMILNKNQLSESEPYPLQLASSLVVGEKSN